MKSTVLIMAISDESLYTAASSAVSKPTRRFGSFGGASPSSASDRTVGPILAAQPQVLAKPVSDFFLNSAILCLIMDSYILADLLITSTHQNSTCNGANVPLVEKTSSSYFIYFSRLCNDCTKAQLKNILPDIRDKGILVEKTVQ